MQPVDVTRRPVPWIPVGFAFVVGAVLLASTSGQYGYHRDELYFLMLDPAWGYVDQPPLTPWLARTVTSVFGDHLWALRIPATALLLCTVFLSVLTTRELGGGRRAQILCAWGLSFAAIPLAFGHVLLTATVDLAIWAAVLLFATRALVRSQPRWWLAAGACVGIGLLNKHLIVMLLLGVVVGLLLVGPRDALRSGWIWAGAGLALLIAMPNLIYQATNDWPQLRMAGALAERGGSEARALLLPLQGLLLGVGLLPVWVAGFLALLRRPGWRPVRAVAVAYPIILVIALLSAGQFYYPLGLVIFLFAAGCVPTVEWMDRRWRQTFVVGGFLFSSALSVLLALPIVSVADLGDTPIPDINQIARDSVGWPVYVETLVRVYESLPEEERERTVLYTSNYGEAGALDHYGPAYGLPGVYSGHNELWFLGPPPEEAEVVVAWTQNFDGLARFFEVCERRATMDNGVGVDNEEQGAVVAVCRNPVGGWDAVWPQLQHYS